MRFLLFLFLLLSLSFLNNGHPLGDLSLRHKRSSDDEGVLEAIGKALSSKSRTEMSGEKGECYFATKRSTDYENQPRPAHSQVGKCGGDLRPMSELLSEQLLFEQSFQCPNYLAMILFRGQGEYSINWKDTDQVSAIGKNLICEHHETELGTGWDKPRYYHYKFKRRPNMRIEFECSIPFPFETHSTPEYLHDELHRIEADEAKAILHMRGVLLHPGLPICKKHNEEAQKILAQYLVEQTGHNIRPAPLRRDFSQTPSITRDVNAYSDDRGENDPAFFPHPRESSVPLHPPPSKHSPEIETAYIAFMKAIGQESSIATKKWHELDDRSQRRKSEGLVAATNVMADLMAPNDPRSLKEKAFKGSALYERPRSADYTFMMHTVKEAFENSPSRAGRLAALSIISHLSLSEIQRYIPRLSRYYLTDARKYARRGYFLPKGFHTRIKYRPRIVDRFLQFVTSSKVTIRSPYGTRQVKDSNNKWIDIPNTLRALRVGEIYRLYQKELTDNNELDLLIPESTARKMLKICSAERRKSLHGVDVIIADAMEAFDRAEMAIDKMRFHNWISQSWRDSLHSMMLATRQYFRTDYLIHSKEYSTTADHCWQFALSEKDDLRFQTDCEKKKAPWEHSHTRVCSQCEAKQVWFGDMRATMEELLKKYNGDSAMLNQIELLRRDFYDWEEKIDRLKAHQLRTAKAENDRQWIVADLKEGTAQITLDFAMRLLPHNPRESTVDWYAQRGMVWHVGHVLTFDQGDYKQHSYVHIFQGERQDSATVTAIIRSLFIHLKKKSITRLYLRSDQAGVYKCSSTIASVHAIAEEVGVEVVGWYFSEAQSGKGPCDRYAAVVKRVVRDAADSNIPVLDPSQFYEAVTQGKLHHGISYELVRLEGSGKDKEVMTSDTKINDLSKFNSFTYEKNALRLHRFWRIGTGSTVPYTDFHANDAILHVEKEGGALSEEDFWAPLGDPKQKEHHSMDEDEEDEDEDSVCEKDKESKRCKEKKKFVSALYRCPVESCAKEFISERNLERHLTVGKHLRRPERENVLDYALHNFSRFLEAVAPPPVCKVVDDTLSEFANANENGVQLQMGWALPKRRASRRFPKEVTKFLRTLYDEGERTGVKTDPRGAEALMRTATKQGGGMMFALDDLLTSRQIAGVYSRFKKSKLEGRKKTGGRDIKKHKPNEEEEDENDEVNQLFDTEGDEELEYKSDPLFDEEEGMRRAISEMHDTLFIPEEHEEMKKGEKSKAIKKDPSWSPPPPTTSNLPDSEYVIVSRNSLLSLLRKCTKCLEGEYHLSFHMDGLALTCKRECNVCGAKSNWRNTTVLHTAKESSKEQLPKINVDIVTGAVVTAVGGTKLREVLLMSGISSFSQATFHKIKKHYVIPAVDKIFWIKQGAIIDALRERIAQGEIVHVSGDGSFDSRGYSAAWCRYYLLNAETGEVLHYILIHKTETGSSGTMEVEALERGLRELALMIGGTEGIASVVTDRHKAVTKMMRDKYPGIKHFYDPWHFFRNITLTLITICKASYMAKARFWVKPIINRCYDAVLTAQGNGEVASEKFRAILKCMTGQHTFDKDPSFKTYKACTHRPPTNPDIFIPKNGRIYERLASQVFTERNIEDIKQVSWLLQTSPCESINALSWRYGPKEYYYTRPGHHLRTRLSMIHWNHLKSTAANGTRPVSFHVGKKSYTNPTHKKLVWRKVRKTANHTWRTEIKEMAYKIRHQMCEAPETTLKKMKAELIRKRKEWETRTRPVFPAAGDSNLEAEHLSSDEEEEDDAILSPPLSSTARLALLAYDTDLELSDSDGEEDDEE